MTIRRTQTQDAAARRAGRARRAAVAPRDPEAAKAVYQEAMSRYADRVSALVGRRLEKLKDGDSIDAFLAALGPELASFESALMPTIQATARRVSTFGKAEARRLVRTKIGLDLSDAWMQAEFVTRNAQLVRGLAERQVEALRRALEAAGSIDDAKRLARHAVWVSRVQGQVIATDQVRRFGRETVTRWCTAVGTEGFVYHARNDGRERATHRAHDGHFFLPGQLPSTLQEPNCRCCVIPVEALRKR